MAEKPTPIDYVECYKAVFLDWLAYHPEDLSGTERDYKRIALEASSRGLPFFTIDLPAIGKIFDRALAEKRLVRSGAAHMRPYRHGSVIPRLFKGFWLRVFDDDGRILEAVDPTTIAFMRLFFNLVGKLKLEAPSRYVNQTLKEFYNVEHFLSKPSVRWREIETSGPRQSRRSLCDFYAPRRGLFPIDPLIHRGRDGERNPAEAMEPLGRVVPISRHQRGNRPPAERGIPDRWLRLHRCQYAANLVASSLGLFSPDEILPAHGPGAVSEALGGSEKYSFPSWSPRLEEVFPFSEFGTHALDSFLINGEPVLYPPIEEGASRLIAVPKTQKGPRLIAAEPTANQWVQQGIARLLRERVAKCFLGSSIDFFDQRPSQDAALLASYTGEYATIDLSSASDRLSCNLVESFFGANDSLLRMLTASRTRFLSNPTFVGFPKLIELKKFASMGSALTFPIQSIVFAGICLGVGSYLTGRDPRALVENVRVFGDDLIVPVGWVPDLIEVLDQLELKVNIHKTFYEGNFRESCGMDAWSGYNVTPPRLRKPSTALNTREALGHLDIVNNFWLKGYWHLSKYLETTARWMKNFSIVNCRSRAYGLATFSSGLDPKAMKRWDENYQREVVRVHRVVPGKTLYGQTDGWNDLTEFFFRKERENRFPRWGDGLLDHLDPVLHIGLQERAIQRSGSTAIVRRAWVPVEFLV